MRLVPAGRMKYVLAGLGAAYIVLFVAYLVYAGVTRSMSTKGPSELEQHPEKQGEIRAKQRVDQFRGPLRLSDDQAQKVTEILKKYAPGAGLPEGDPRERFKAVQEEMAKVLTPEQQERMKQMRPGGPPGGPGGPGGRRGGPPGMNPERLDALKQAMTPEQKERFEKQLERMRQRMPGGPGGPGGPPGFPGGPPPGGPDGGGGPPPPPM